MVHKTFAAFLFCLAAVAADLTPDVCEDCEFSPGGLGYVPGENCLKFYQCVRQPDGSISHTLLCCPNGTLWNQTLLTCVHGECDAERYPMCPPPRNETDGNCTLEAVASDPTKFTAFDADGNAVQMMCPAGTIFVPDNCTCGHGGNTPCYDDPLLHFPFAYDFDDIQCPKAVGTGHGNAFVNTDGGYLQVDGNGDFVSFGYLKNYFTNNNPKHFTVSLWFKQTTDGYLNLNNLPEGLIGNGDCNENPTFYMTLANQTAGGGITADSTAEFLVTDGDADARGYAPAEVWCQMSIRVEPGYVTLFLNGLQIGDKRPIVGNIQGTQAATTIGLTYLDCIPNFFTGCIDDVMVFVRYVSDVEMSWCVFGNRRTGPGEETMYMCDNVPVWIPYP